MSWIRVNACSISFLLALGLGASAEANPAHDKFFEEKVRPLLSEHCFSCHGDSKQKSGLRLDSREGLLKGGKGGVVFVPERPEQSRLLLAVRYTDADLQMPPENRLTPQQVEVLEQWVKMGAPWPGNAALSPLGKSKRRTITPDDEAFWSFQKVKDVQPPAVEDGGWSRNDVDRFIFAKLAAEGLKPAPEAERRTLIRRLTLDLHGLPPTQQEIDAFVNDPSPGAYDALVDRLLASPRYGERWARQWLDLVRYAESDGYKQDAYRTNSWPYRDYVIKSLNADKPYDRFVLEQLAGDEIAPDDPEVMVATGYLRHQIYEYNQADARQQWTAILNDLTDTTADVFLGVSLGCARCHDHKFDPILQTDYYRFQAFFTPVLPRNDLPLTTPQVREKYAQALAVWEEKTRPIRARIAEIEGPAYEKAKVEAINKFPLDIRDIVYKSPGQRTLLEEQLAQLAWRQVVEKTANLNPKLPAKEKEEYEALKKKLAEHEKDKPAPLLIGLTATDVAADAPPTTVPGRSDAGELQPGYPVVLEKKGLRIPEFQKLPSSTGRRTALAQWITQPDHPLTARVMVNRLWQGHFGQGIVATASDYGRLGDKPSHPELLDYLARRFVAEGWSLKKMHRLMVTSAAYRQDSRRLAPEIAKVKDPENRWLWKFSGRRMEAEQIRDSMLLASGELKPDGGGPAVDGTEPRRSIYTKQTRNVRDPMLDVFDLPESFGSIAERHRTTTAIQALLMMNGDWPLKRAEAMAQRIAASGAKEPATMVEAAFRFAHGRMPSPRESDSAVAFLQRERAKITAPQIAEKRTLTTEDKPLVKTMPHRGTQAIYVRSNRADDMLRLTDPSALPAEDFTVEAFVQLDSLYDDASVRVIASQWDGDQKHPGWSLGVTSTKSRFEPSQLILQLVGDPANKAGGYEVIPSGFRIELHKTYYVAVSVRIADTSETGVTFYVKDLTDMDASLRSAGVRHAVTGHYSSESTPLVIGGRDSTPMHGWDGLIDELRISRKALAPGELLYNDGVVSKDLLCGHWLFEDQAGLLRDSAGIQKELVKRAGGQVAARSAVPSVSQLDPGLVDLCHVLLNSNEFIYID